MNTHRIRHLGKAKKRLSSAIKRFRQASEFLDSFFAEVPDELKNKQAWSDMPPEYHLLRDCQRNIRGVRQQTLRLVFQIHLAQFHERKRRRLEEADNPALAQNDEPEQEE